MALAIRVGAQYSLASVASVRNQSAASQSSYRSFHVVGTILCRRATGRRLLNSHLYHHAERRAVARSAITMAGKDKMVSSDVGSPVCLSGYLVLLSSVLCNPKAGTGLLSAYGASMYRRQRHHWTWQTFCHIKFARCGSQRHRIMIEQIFLTFWHGKLGANQVASQKRSCGNRPSKHRPWSATFVQKQCAS